MPNSFLTPSVIAREALMHMENEMTIAKMVTTDFEKEFKKVGNSIDIRRPAQYAAQSDDLDVTSTKQDILQGKTTLTLNKTETVAVTIGPKEMTLDFDRLSEDVIKPAAIVLKDRIEEEIAKLYYKAYHFDGTAGTTLGTFKAIAQHKARLTQGSVPLSGRCMFHDPDVSVEVADGLKGVYVDKIAKTALEEATFGRYAGFAHYEHVHAVKHAHGVATGTPLVNGGSQNVAYSTDAVKNGWKQDLVTDGWTNSTTGILKKGDVITIDGVNMANPVNGADMGKLQTFTVLEDADSGASTGPATLSISPPIITSGAWKTVTAAPADNAPITVVSHKTGDVGQSYPQSISFTKNAIALVSAPLAISDAGLKTSTMAGNHCVISVTEWGDGNDLSHNFRFDILYDCDVIDPRYMGRITS